MITPSQSVAGFVPNLPNLSNEVGHREALQRNGVPNLPNLPNLRRVRTSAHTPAPPRVHAGTIPVLGWEGWEGWEEAVRERGSSSQPVFKGWEGWEPRGLSCH